MFCQKRIVFETFQTIRRARNDPFIQLRVATWDHKIRRHSSVFVGICRFQLYPGSIFRTYNIGNTNFGHTLTNSKKHGSSLLTRKILNLTTRCSILRTGCIFIIWFIILKESGFKYMQVLKLKSALYLALYIEFEYII